MKTVNPANGEIVKEYTEISDKEINSAIKKAQEQFASWHNTSFEETIFTF